MRRLSFFKTPYSVATAGVFFGALSQHAVQKNSYFIGRNNPIQNNDSDTESFKLLSLMSNKEIQLEPQFDLDIFKGDARDFFKTLSTLDLIRTTYHFCDLTHEVKMNDIGQYRFNPGWGDRDEPRYFSYVVGTNYDIRFHGPYKEVMDRFNLESSDYDDACPFERLILKLSAELSTIESNVKDLPIRRAIASALKQALTIKAHTLTFDLPNYPLDNLSKQFKYLVKFLDSLKFVKYPSTLEEASVYVSQKELKSFSEGKGPKSPINGPRP